MLALASPPNLRPHTLLDSHAARGDVDEGFSDEQMHELATAEEDVDERMREIQRIAKSVEGARAGTAGAMRVGAVC